MPVQHSQEVSDYTQTFTVFMKYSLTHASKADAKVDFSLENRKHRNL